MGGEMRMIVDYRALNKVTTKTLRFPLPRIDGLFDKLQGPQWFTSLDAASGVHQILLQETDQSLLPDFHLATTSSGYCPLASPMYQPHSKP